MNDYIIKRTDEGFTRSTVIVDIKALTEFSKCIDKDINVLNEKDLRKFFAYLSGKSKATSRLYITQVGSFLSFDSNARQERAGTDVFLRLVICGKDREPSVLDSISTFNKTLLRILQRFLL